MEHRFTKLSDAALRSYLAKVRRVAAMSDDDAILELDELIHNLAQRGVAGKRSSKKKRQEKADYDLHRRIAENDLRDFKEELARLRAESKRNEVGVWDVDFLRNRIRELGSGWHYSQVREDLRPRIEALREEANALLEPLAAAAGRKGLAELEKRIEDWQERARSDERPEWLPDEIRQGAKHFGDEWNDSFFRDVLESEIERLKQEARGLADSIEVEWSTEYVHQAQDETIYSISSVKKILRRLGAAEEMLQRRGALTDEMEKRILNAKRRCATFRAQKKLAEAEVASKTGSPKRESKLRVEAEVLLKEDWKLVFTSDVCPDLHDL